MLYVETVATVAVLALFVVALGRWREQRKRERFEEIKRRLEWKQ